MSLEELLASGALTEYADLPNDDPRRDRNIEVVYDLLVQGDDRQGIERSGLCRMDGRERSRLSLTEWPLLAGLCEADAA